MLQGLLTAFVDHIKDRKTVVLEDLAAHFGLRVQVETTSGQRKRSHLHQPTSLQVAWIVKEMLEG